MEMEMVIISFLPSFPQHNSPALILSLWLRVFVVGLIPVSVQINHKDVKTQRIICCIEALVRRAYCRSWDMANDGVVVLSYI